MQGQLRDESIRFSITTECGHCARPIHLETDGRMACRVVERDAAPLVFTPAVDFSKLTRPSIIDDF